MNLQQTLQRHIAEAAGIPAEEVVLEHPGDLSHGDYATPMALMLAKKEGANPKEVAESIAEKLEKQNIPEVEKIEVAGPGFINFYLTRNYFADSVKEITEQGKRFGNNEILKGQKVLFEYTDPNPFKVFHIGHLMPNVIGESLARLYERSGALVSRACYQGDVGLHVAKAIATVLAHGGKLPAETASPQEKAMFFSSMYVEGNTKYEEDEIFKAEVIRVNKAVYDRSDEEINRIYDLGRQWSLDNFERLYQILGTSFNHYFFESETGKIGKKLVEENLGKVFEESQGAVIYKGEDVGLHTRVFINSEGLPTYEAKELGLALRKFTLAEWDQSITVTANETNDYFKVVYKALEMIEPHIASRTRVISHGLLRFAEGKMSSRKGNVITGESLIEEMIAAAEEKMFDSELTAEEKESVARDVGVAAIKLSILRQTIGKDSIFDKEKSISLEGDSGPYVQYTAVRANSVLEKAQSNVGAAPGEVSTLEKLLYRFPEVIHRARLENSPHGVSSYLLDVAGAFNAWYATTKIIDGSEYQGYRLQLTNATKIVLTNGLEVLGIRVPARM